jgi:two-component system phosphate regulon sensor histidine kinase PhoR
VEVTVPITSNGKVLAILNIGKRNDGKRYSKKDILLLSITSDYAGAVLKNIQLHEKEKTYSIRLEEQVQQRTAELQELQCAQKQSMLDISHGLQGPLTLLRAELESAQQHSGKGLYSKLTGLVDKVSDLAYELVTMARLNTTKPQGEPSLVNLTDLFNKNMVALYSTAEQYKVTLHYHADKDIHIKGAAGDIQRMLLNLVKNALKYTSITDKKTKTVNVSLTTNSTGNTATLTVADNGVGIPKSALPKIFDTFYRVDDTTSVDGAGIGLTIVKRIVETHDGTIEVKSSIGSGTTFTVLLPMIKL